VPHQWLVLCESEKAEGERLVIDKETNGAPPQFGVGIAGSIRSIDDRNKFKFAFKFGSIVSEN
jgi:hypothetical protein